jgi:GT2 family glycosyltransferase
MLEDIALCGEYFDEDFFAYFEDVDLDWRAQQRGWKCIYTPYAVGYHVRYGSDLIKNPSIAACLLSNRLFLMIKNDMCSAVAQDFRPIVRRTLQDYGYYISKNPLAVAIALWRLIRFAPKMFRKRFIIGRRRLAGREYLRGLIK